MQCAVVTSGLLTDATLKFHKTFLQHRGVVLFQSWSGAGKCERRLGCESG
jgi:hypothetical protein